MVLGHNVRAEFDEKSGRLTITIETRDKPRSTTDKGNDIIATTGGNKDVAGGKLGVNFYRPKA